VLVLEAFIYRNQRYIYVFLVVHMITILVMNKIHNNHGHIFFIQKIQSNWSEEVIGNNFVKIQIYLI
jgi:hypothetical protein